MKKQLLTLLLVGIRAIATFGADTCSMLKDCSSCTDTTIAASSDCRWCGRCVSKLSADILVQEYGRYFGMKTCVLRGGCLTGPNHKGVELHGFLSWLVKCNLSSSNYKIFGHKGKQVRDNLHSEDVADFINLFIESPRPAAVYNIGGGFGNSISVLEAIDAVEEISGIKMKSSYISEARKGDHIVYYSNLSKMRKDYPEWKIQWSLENIIESLVKSLDE